MQRETWWCLMGFFFKKILGAMSLDPVALVRECAESIGSGRTSVFFFLAFKGHPDLEELKWGAFYLVNQLFECVK